MIFRDTYVLYLRFMNENEGLKNEHLSMPFSVDGSFFKLGVMQQHVSLGSPTFFIHSRFFDLLLPE